MGALADVREARAEEQAQKEEAISARQAMEIERRKALAQAKLATENHLYARRLLYASDMNLAQQALETKAIGTVRRLLDRHRPKSDEEDLRGWGWRYLWQQARSSEMLTLTNRNVRAWDLSVSHDGKALAIGWMDGQVDLWDLPARRFVRSLSTQASIGSGIGRVCFSPTGHLLATRTQKNQIEFHDLKAKSRQVIWKAPNDGDWRIHRFVFSDDGSRFVVYAWQPRVRTGGLWVIDVASAEIVNHIVTDSLLGTYHHSSVRFSPNNKRLYFSGRAPSRGQGAYPLVQCIDLASKRLIWKAEESPDMGLTALEISPDGRFLVSATGFKSHSISIRESETGRLVKKLDGHAGFVFVLQFSEDGSQLFSASADSTIRLWDTQSWTQSRELRGHTHEVMALAVVHPEGLLVSGAKDGSVKLWEISQKNVRQSFFRLPESINVAELQPFRTTKMLNAPKGKLPELVDLNEGGTSSALTGIDSRGELLPWFHREFLCSWDGSGRIVVHEKEDEGLVEVGRVETGLVNRPVCLGFSREQQLVAWGKPETPSVFLAKLGNSGRRIELRSDLPDMEISEGQMNEDATFLVARGSEAIRAWNIGTGEIVVSIEDVDNYTSYAFAADGQVLVVALVIEGGARHEIRFYDLDQPERVHRSYFGKEYITGMDVSADSQWVAVATLGGAVRIYNSVTREPMLDLQGHENAARGVSFSGNGERLVSARYGTPEVKLWDVNTGQKLLTLEGEGSLWLKATWSADGDAILVGPPWEAWVAPSWEDIEEAERK